MRIFVASGIFHPENGGPATYLYHLLPEFVARGHPVTALAFGDAPTEGYPYPLTRIPRWSYLRRQRDYYRAASRLWPGHDLAYLQGLNLPLPPSIRPRIAKIVGDQAWERAMNKGWVRPNTDVDEFQTRRYGPVVEINKALQAQDARACDHLIVPSAYLKRMVTGWGVPAERISVIYNAVGVGRSAAKVDQRTARARLGLPDGPLLLTPARLAPWKGIDHSLRALAEMKQVRLAVAGDGPERAALERLAQELGVADRTLFVGRVPVEEMRLYYRAADYVLLYSGYEGLSHVLVEALMAGTPVIVSNKGGNPEIVQDGVNGILVDYVNIEALISAITQALAPGRRAELAANTSNGLERFEWGHMVSRTLATLERFAPGAGRR